MSSSLTIQLGENCVSKFNDLKLGKSIKYIIYKLEDDYKSIVVEETSETAGWDASTDEKAKWNYFREKLIKAESKDIVMGKEKVGLGPRYAVYDFQYDAGEGQRNKILFIAWSPDDGLRKPKMVSASSKDSLKQALNGIAVEIQANDADDIEYQVIHDRLVKGR